MVHCTSVSNRLPVTGKTLILKREEQYEVPLEYYGAK